MDAVEIACRIRDVEMSAEEAITEAVKRARQVNGQLNAIIANRYEAAIEEAMPWADKRPRIVADA